MAAATPHRRTTRHRRARGGAAAALLAGLILAAIAIVSLAPDGEAAAGDDAIWLVVQTAREGTLTPLPGDAGRVMLRLRGVGPFVTAFTDRPAHRTAVAPTAPVLAAFFEGEPPNAALTTTVGGELTTVILELLSASYDEAAGEVAYEARLLAETHRPAFALLAVQGALAQPITFGDASLVIDGFDCVKHPTQYALC